MAGTSAFMVLATGAALTLGNGPASGYARSEQAAWTLVAVGVLWVLVSVSVWDRRQCKAVVDTERVLGTDWFWANGATEESPAMPEIAAAQESATRTEIATTPEPVPARAAARERAEQHGRRPAAAATPEHPVGAGSQRRGARALVGQPH